MASGALEQASTLQAFGAELKNGGEDVTKSGNDWGRAGAKLQTRVTTCLQCGNTDGLIAYLEKGRIVKLEGSLKHPNTRGRLCAKGQAGLQQVYDPFRIKWPMKRVGKRGDPDAAWKRITWEEATDEVAKRLGDIRSSGDPGRFVFHQGRNRFSQFAQRFTKAMGTKHYLTHTSYCEASLKVGYENSFGQNLGTPDSARSKYILDFGDNILECSYMHHALPQRIMEGRYLNGAKNVVFDPRLSHTAGRADEWFPLNVGTDAAVILAMCNVILEEGLHDREFLDEWTNFPASKLAAYLKQYTPTKAEAASGVAAADIKRIAIEFAKAAPACYAYAYNGLSNHSNGAYNVRCLALLNAVVGSYDKPGGFGLMKFTGWGAVDPEPDIEKVLAEIGAADAKFPIEEDHLEKYPLASHGTDHLLPHRLIDLDYKVKFYMLHQYNPLYAAADRELWLKVLSDKKRVEFILDFSPFWSETAKLVADMIIPDCTYLERTQMTDMPCVENFPFVELWQPAVQPLYESRSMYDTMLAVAGKIGGGMEKYFAFDTITDYVGESIDAVWGEGAFERLQKDGVLIGDHYDPATYKSFDELSEAEKSAMRKFNTYSKKLSDADMDELRAKGAVLPSAEKAEGKAAFTSAPIKDKSGKKTVGIMKSGIAYKGFPTGSGLFEIFSDAFKEHGFDPMPTYKPVASLAGRSDDELALITGKINVHTQSRTANCAWLTEISHYNPAWIHPSVAKKHGLVEEDDIIIESGQGVKEMPCRVHITEGINPGAIFISTSLGHWEYGALASKGKNPFNGRPLFEARRELPGTPFEKGYSRKTTSNLNPLAPKSDVLVGSTVRINANDLVRPKKSPVVKDYKGRSTVGWSPNAILATDAAMTDPIGGEYAWCDTTVRIRKA